MKAIIVGSGLLGVTSAYFLARRGWEVVVIDRCAGPAEETSFANGAVLTPSMPEPWNAPGSWRVLIQSLGRRDSVLQLRLKALSGLGSWGVSFLKNSSAARYERNTRNNLRLALHSIEMLKALRQETKIEYGGAATGSLRVFRDPAALEQALAWAQRLRSAGLTFRSLTAAETVTLEPALAPIGARLAGGIHYPGDELGNAHEFCVQLAEAARRRGVAFHFGTAVREFHASGGRVTAVACERTRFTGDHFVVAAGSYSPLLLGPLGVRLPVRPVKGYSLTFDRPPRDPPLRIPIADDDFNAVVVPLQNVLRVAGTAEFAGYDLSLPEVRLRNLSTLLDEVLPSATFDRSAGRPWCGLRPMSPDGVPIIGATPIGNLWVNTGHGPLGWTMAAGSGHLLADLMSAVPPGVEPESFALARFRS